MSIRILGIDLETTGLDTKEDRIIEVGAVVWDVAAKTPLEIYSQFVKPPPEKFPLPEVITNLTGIQDSWLRDLGVPFVEAAAELSSLCLRHQIKYVLAHNGENFDKPLFCAEVERSIGKEEHLLCRMPWIDTRSDLPHEVEPESRKLKHLALDKGFINPFPHRAVFDVLTMLKVASHYDFQKIAELSQVPWVTMRALVDYDSREKAKELRYSWEKLGDKAYPKMWVRRIRENQIELETQKAEKLGFKAVRIN